MSYKKSFAHSCLFIAVAEVLTTGIGAAAGAAGSAILTEFGLPGYVAGTAAAQLAIGNAALSLPLYTCCNFPCFLFNAAGGASDGAFKAEKSLSSRYFPTPIKACIAMNTLISLALAPLVGQSLYTPNDDQSSMDLLELNEANGVGLLSIAATGLALACLATCLFVAVRIGGIFVIQCLEDCRDQQAARRDADSIPLTANGAPASYSERQTAF